MLLHSSPTTRYAAPAFQPGWDEEPLGPLGPLHRRQLSLDSNPHHSLSEQDVPSRSAFKALIGWGFIGR